MFTDKLFDHKYDVDDIIRALCGDDHTGRWLLCTHDGWLVQEQPGSPETQDIKDGDDNNHWHVITPLPKSFLQEMKLHNSYKRLDANLQAEINETIDNTNAMFELIPLFDKHRAGGWMRERVKDAALEWLEMKDMIPPSMRHVRDSSMFNTAKTTNVQIED